MSMADHTDPLQITPDPATLHAFHRQQLSAMLDGELSPDEAKFMLRRLEHDSELAQCWERWQICGEVLRGRADDVLPVDFAARVAVAIQAPLPRAQARLGQTWRRPHLRAWGGVGMAASLALVTVVLVVKPPADEIMPDSVTVMAAADAPIPQVLPEAPVMVSGAQVVHVVPEPPPVAEVAALTPDRSEHAARELLAPMVPPDPIIPRPWPQAGMGAGSLTVGYGAPPVMPMDPFQPRWVPPPSIVWPEPGEHPLPVYREARRGASRQD